MKKILITISIIVGFLNSEMVSGQVNVHHVTDIKGQPTGQGTFYTLPRTVLKIDVIIKSTEQLKGPYSDYAERFLGLESVNKYDFTTWNIQKVVITTQTEPDPSQVYFVEMTGTDSKEQRQLQLQLDEAGMLLRAGDVNMPGIKEPSKTREVTTFENPSNGKQFPEFYTTKHVETNIDTIIRKVAVDTAMTEQLFYRQRLEDKSTDEMAANALQQIQQIRESKYKLITGFQETAYDPGSIKFMFNRLDHLENEYLDLFRGKSFDDYYHYTYYVVPEPKNGSYTATLFRFSTGSGITEGKSGEPVQLEITGTNAGEKTGALPGIDANTGIAYRLPGIAEVKVNYEGKVFYENRLPVNQLGLIERLPARRFNATFDPETGGIKTLFLERGEK